MGFQNIVDETVLTWKLIYLFIIFIALLNAVQCHSTSKYPGKLSQVIHSLF